MIPAPLVDRAQKFRRWYRAQVLELFKSVDVILAPATPCVAPKLGQATFVLDGVELPVRANIGIHTQPISFIGLPVVAVPDFIEQANAAIVKLIPGARPVPFGHLGDGNIHYNVSQPVGGDSADFLARWHEVNAVVFDIVLRMGGSISAEHGIGVLKRDELPDVKDKVAIELMRAIKAMLDPLGIMNPGKVL